MGNNSGISASGGANVSGNAVASGSHSTAEVHVAGPLQAGGEAQPSAEELRELLARLIDELDRSGHPERADLIEEIGAAREELAAPTPRTGRLRRFAAGIGPTMQGLTSLAALWAAIERAIQGL